jgi:6,7-dimethyl-8-ribityllumazine synthase
LQRDVKAALADSPGIEGKKVGIVVAEFYPELAEWLLDGARRALSAGGIDEGDVTIARVAGCFELPVAAMRLLGRDELDAIVALGVIVRGETPHFEYVAGECARGLMSIQLTTGAPVGFGVLTVDTIAQAEERADPARRDKGFEAAAAALRVLSISSDPESKPLGFRR